VSPARSGRGRAARAIVVATDFSTASRAAFAAALDTTRQQRARLVVLHVLVPPSPFAGGDLPGTWIELEARARNDANRRLAAAVSEAERAGIAATGALVRGVPAEAIVRVARREGADLIVIGTHGRSGLGRLFMGSVASRVLVTAGCPVLTVRGRPGRGARR
jgi:nucleotide-binding universal stress UspA family protein